MMQGVDEPAKRTRTIKVTQETWEELDKLRDWRATFNDVIKGLLKLHQAMMAAAPLIEGQQKFYQEKLERARAEETANTG